MRILTFNCGTSTLRFDLADSDHGFGEPVRLAQGIVEGIGGAARVTLSAGPHDLSRELRVSNHVEAFNKALELLGEAGHGRRPDAIGHRIVQGGLQLQGPALINAGVVEAIERAGDLAPLHNAAALAVIGAARARFPAMPMVAAFDTTFYLDLPEVSRRYALPREVSDRFGFRRFGFQGLAHRYMVQRYRALHPGVRGLRLITLQLGADCSVTASVDGQPVDTSMGFTLLEGLVMATRSGSIDPTIPLHMIESGEYTVGETRRLLNTRSGLLGLAGESDFKTLLARATSGDNAAALAFDAFCFGARKYVGSYMALLGGAEAIVFGGGIGEHSPEVRRAICDGLRFAGVVLDERWNSLPAREMAISTDDSPVKVWVMRVDEAAVMVDEVMRVLSGPAGTAPA